MSRRAVTCVIISLLALQALASETTVKIAQLTGEVKIRRGVEENWQPAIQGMRLHAFDTILTLEGEAELQLPDGEGRFHLKPNSMLDIADLKRITERELFLRLMAEKVSRIKPRQEKVELKVGNISTIHGSQAGRGQDEIQAEELRQWRQREFNAALAMIDQEFLPNAALKLHKIAQKYAAVQDCGETHYYLGQTFIALDKPGQAVDEFKLAIERAREHACEDSQTRAMMASAQSAIDELQSQ